MRTTVDLPDDLIQKAKIAAIQQKTTLRDLFSRALIKELNTNNDPKNSLKPKTKFPIFSSKSAGSLDISTADLLRLDEIEDSRQNEITN